MPITGFHKAKFQKHQQVHRLVEEDNMKVNTTSCVLTMIPLEVNPLVILKSHSPSGKLRIKPE